MMNSPQDDSLNPSPLVLHDPDLFLVELRFEPLFLRLPETQTPTCVAYLIDPVVFHVELTRRAEPGAFRLAFPSPAAKLADHPCVKCAVDRRLERLAHVVALGKQDLGNEWHPCSRAV